MNYAIFDMDGTLINSMEKWTRLIYDYIEDLHLRPDEKFLKELKTKTLETSIHLIHETFNIDRDISDGMNFIYKLIQHGYANEFDLKPHVKEFLETLKENNIKMCVATATEDSLAIPALERFGLLDYFEFVQTCKNSGYHKYEPDFWELAIENLYAIKEECVVFEDALYCIETTTSMGIKTVGIKDKTTVPDQEKIEQLVVQYVSDYNEIDLTTL